MGALSARLTKTERKEYREQIIQQKGNHIVSICDISYLWSRLSSDHFHRLKSELKHIQDIPILETLKGDSLECDDFRLSEYLPHYSAHELKTIQELISNARQGLDYLQDHINKEMQRRG